MLHKMRDISLVAVSVVGISLAVIGSAEARHGRHGAFLGGSLLTDGYRYRDGYQPRYYGNCDCGYGAYDGGFLRPCHFERRFVDDYGPGHWVRVKICD